MHHRSRLGRIKALDSGAVAGPWIIDKMILTYMSATSLLMLLFLSHIPQAWWLLALKAAGALLIMLAWRSSSLLSWLFRHWYPAIYVAASYKELNYLIPALGAGTNDVALARLDLAIFHVNPTVWIGFLQTPLLTEYLQVVYAFFIPAVLLVAYILWRQRRLPEFRYYAFLISLGYLISYCFYLIVPARGPRFLLANLHHTELQGYWTFQWLRNLLDSLEGIHYDCFPSGHTVLTLLAWWTSRLLSRWFFFAFTVFTVSQIFSTVYLRYHYVVDLVAGGLVAVALLSTVPYFYAALQPSK